MARRRFLPQLRGATLEVKGTAADRRASQGTGYYYAGNPYISSWNTERAVKDGYERVIWVFKAIDAIADKVSSWPIKVMDGYEPDWKEVDDPIKAVLNQQANAIDGPAKFFRYRLSTQLLLSKPGVFVEVIVSRAGAPIALNLLPPTRTFIIPGTDGQIEKFEVQMADGDRPRLNPYKPGKGGVLWIRKPHPIDPYSGVTPLEAAGISIDLDFYARLYNRNFLLNDGRGGQIVAVKGGLSTEDAQELKARFSPGMNGAGRTTVLEADSVSVSDTAVSPRDAQYAELRGITKEDILIALGTPESVIGNASGRTFDNADAEKENWLTETVLPHSSVVESGFDILTEGGLDDDRSVVHDTSNEPVLQRAHRAKVNEARGDLDAGRITIAEFREIAKLEALDVAGSKVLWTPHAGKIPVGEEADVAAALALMPVGMGPPPDPEAEMGEPQAEDPFAEPPELPSPTTGAFATPQGAPQALGEPAGDEGLYGPRGLPWESKSFGLVESDDPDLLAAMLSRS